MTFRPLHDRVLVRRVEENAKTPGGIIIPDTAKEKPQEGEVIAVGAGTKAEDGKVTDPAVEQRMTAAFAEIEKIPGVTAVVSPYEPGSQAISKNGTTAFATVQFDKPTPQLDQANTRKVIKAAEAADNADIQVALAGQPIKQAETQSGSGTEGIGLLAAIIILLITFGSVVAMGMPIITALLALGTGLSLLTLSTHVFDVADFAPQLAAMIGLGVGIDYALFIVTRFRGGLAEGRDVHESIVLSLNTAGRAVLFAGTTVIVALLGMMLLGISFLYGLSIAAALAVLFTMIAALTLLPALLAMVGKRIDGLSLRRKSKGPRPEIGPLWLRWSKFIQRRKWSTAVVSGLFMLMLCIPALSLELGEVDSGSDPKDSTTRQAYDMLSKGFGPGFNGPLQVVVDINGPSAETQADVKQLEADLAKQPGVSSVTPALYNKVGDTAVLDVYPTTSPQSEKTTDLLDDLRGTTIPAATAGTDLTVYVGGITAIFEDFTALIGEKLPLFFGVVVLISALLLMLLFRSILVPIKAVFMNLLSIGAAFGVVVAVFQWGWLAGPLGIDSTGPVDAFLPVMLFAIVFGLSMDYEVFLVSRIHEEWEKRGDASVAAQVGIAATGRVITAAATIMVCVFAAFVLGDNRVIKLFGIGLASAVFLDAFVIRTTLVPAIMEIFGKTAWWIPKWLDKILPRLHVEGDVPPPPNPQHD